MSSPQISVNDSDPQQPTVYKNFSIQGVANPQQPSSPDKHKEGPSQPPPTNDPVKRSSSSPSIVTEEIPQFIHPEQRGRERSHGMSVNSDVSVASSVKHRDTVDYHPEEKRRNVPTTVRKRASLGSVEAISDSEEENGNSIVQAQSQGAVDPRRARMRRASSIDSEATTQSVIVNHSIAHKSSQGVEQYVQEISSAVHHLRTEYSEVYNTCVNRLQDHQPVVALWG